MALKLMPYNISVYRKGSNNGYADCLRHQACSPDEDSHELVHEDDEMWKILLSHMKAIL